MDSFIWLSPIEHLHRTWIDRNSRMVGKRSVVLFRLPCNFLLQTGSVQKRLSPVQGARKPRRPGHHFLVCIGPRLLLRTFNVTVIPRSATLHVLSSEKDEMRKQNEQFLVRYNNQTLTGTSSFLIAPCLTLSLAKKAGNKCAAFPFSRSSWKPGNEYDVGDMFLYACKKCRG